MLKKMVVKNLTVFTEADMVFGRNLNVFIGVNGVGKTHLLKVAYSMLATSWEEGRKPNASTPTKALLQHRFAEKLVNVFRPEALGRLTKRKQGRARCDISLEFSQEELNISIGFSTNSKSEVIVDVLPYRWISAASVYLPTRELLTIFPNFVSVYEGHYLEFEETWRDTCVLLGSPLQRGIKEKRIQELLRPLEEAMQGTIELDKNGRFYLKSIDGRMEMPLVAEGWRKLGMLARLIATGAMLDNGYLFWDEPEANLNPQLIRAVARSVIDLSRSGIQVFIATHSLFLMREIDILLTQENFDVRFFSLNQSDSGVIVDQGASLDDLANITALDEELAQSDRFLGV